MAKKDKKAKTAEKKVRVAQKQEKKAAQKEKKVSKKPKAGQDSDSDAEDVDLDAVLAEYAKQQEQFLKVTETVSEPPSPRASATILANPSNENEVLLFGGEFFDGALARFYNDLYVYNTNRDEWKMVTSPNSPLPRSGHAWCRGGNAGGVYLFGGEFSSPKQGTFYHYNDFWRFEPGSREWTRLEGKKGPPARSGHRMTFFKNYIILFGGFQDTSQTTRYLQDLWVYDTNSFQWFEPKLPAGTAKPDARSSFSLLPHEGGAVMYGGYSRVKATSISGGGNRKGGGASSRVVLKPVVHQDAWYLRIQAPAADAPANTLPVIRWEKRKRPANAPNPARAGATMCSHKGRAIQFGGVHDVEESEEGIDSEFFNTLYAWNVDRNRYFPLTLRRPRTTAKKPANERGGRRDKGKAAEEELFANLRALEARDGKSSAEAEEALSQAPATEVEEEKIVKPVQFEMPHPRFNAQLTVQNDILYIYGGTYEKGDREFTFDELWAIDLLKLDGVKEIFRRELADWAAAAESDEEEDSDDDDEEDSDEDEEAENPTSPSQSQTLPTTPGSQVIEDQTEEITTSSTTDGLPYPRPFESLRDFYARTQLQWQELLLEEMTRKVGLSFSFQGQSEKEQKTLAFGRAEEKWWDVREEVRQLEDEQTEAGIGDVVSLAEKLGAGGGGVGKRR